MAPRYFANKLDSTLHDNGSILYRPFGPFASVAKVANCPCEDGRSRTVYATGEPDTFFSIPAMTRVRGKAVTGFLTRDERGWAFTANSFGKNGALLKVPREDATV